MFAFMRGRALGILELEECTSMVSAELGRNFSSSLIELLSYVPFFDVDSFEEDIGIRIKIAKMWESSSAAMVLRNRICAAFDLYLLLPYHPDPQNFLFITPRRMHSFTQTATQTIFL